MRILIQRVLEAKLAIDEKVKAEIARGLLVFIGVTEEDTQEDIDYLIKKMLNLRIFSDSEGKMNLSLQDVAGELLCVSQFTLYAATKKGNRPSYIRSAKPVLAKKIYDLFIRKTEEILAKKIQTGIFGADMKISLVNDGPVTVLIDSKNKDF